MKSPSEKIKTLLAIFTILFFLGCQKEDLREAQEINNKTMSSQNLTAREVLNEIKNPIIQKIIRSITGGAGIAESKNFNLAFFSKIIKENQYTTYSVLVSKYSQEKPYYTFFVIQKRDNIEKAGFAKYIPNTTVTNLDVPHFSGVLELYDIEDKLYGRTSFTNGQALPASSNNASKGQECGNVFSIITHTCSHGGGHIPGQSCNNGYTNDAYYEVIVHVVCHVVNSLTPPPDAFAGQSGGGSAGGSSAVIPDIDEIYAFFQSLTTEEQEWSLQHLDTYNQIINYQAQNQWFQESRDFVQEVMDRMRQEPTVFKNMNPFLIEKNIDDSALTPCLKDIVSKIKNSQQQDLAAIMGKLGGTNKPYNVKIKLNSSLPAISRAETSFIDPYNYQIDISTQYLSNATDLALTTTIIHELIHAYFLSLVDDHFLSINSANLKSFPILWNYYVNNFVPQQGNVNHHNQIAESYINIIAASLQGYHTGTAPQSGTEALELYKDLSWIGLENTTAFTNLNIDDKIRILRRSIAEDKNLPVNNSSGVPTYFPNGVICN